MMLHRHRCGIIYTQAFADHLAELQSSEGPDHGDEVLSLDYIRCASGPQAGASWCQLTWIPSLSIPLEDRFLFGSTQLHIHKQTRNGLKGRGIDHDPQSSALRILT